MKTGEKETRKCAQFRPAFFSQSLFTQAHHSVELSGRGVLSRLDIRGKGCGGAAAESMQEAACSAGIRL